MSLFGNAAAAGEEWPIDVLTLDFLVSGRVGVDAQKWGWAYFAPTGQRAAQELRVTVDAMHPTGKLAAPEWVGRTASFAYSNGLVAFIAREPATVAVWQKWAASIGSPVQAEFVAGPYLVAGSALSPDGTLQVMLSDRIAIFDATITRLDDPAATPIEVPCGMLSTRCIQSAALL